MVYGFDRRKVHGTRKKDIKGNPDQKKDKPFANFFAFFSFIFDPKSMIRDLFCLGFETGTKDRQARDKKSLF